MKKRIKWYLFRYFKGQTTVIDAEILQTFSLSNDLTCRIVKHYFCGGSYKQAQFLFFVSESTYYWHIQKFISSLANIVKFQAPMFYNIIAGNQSTCH